MADQRHIPCAFCGGLAAIGYGSTRSLNDIDVFVPDDRFAEIVKAGERHISKPAQRYRDYSEGWNLESAQFIHSGIKIEVGSDRGLSIYDAVESCWIPLPIDFNECQRSRVLGIELSLMHRDVLIAYKTLLARQVDQEDVRAMRKAF